MVKILTLTFLTLVYCSKSSALSCDEKSLCEAWKNSPPIHDRISNGKTIRGPMLSDEDYHERAACFGKPCGYKDPQRMQGLFSEVTSRIQNVVLKGRPLSAATAAEKAVLKTFENAKLLNPETNAGCKRVCSAKGIAKNMSDGMCVCPWMEVSSDEFLIFVMAHEVGHRGDICSSSTDLKPGQHPFEQQSNGGSVIDCLQANGVQGRSFNEEKTYRDNMMKLSAKVAGLNPDSNVGQVVGTALSPITYAVQPTNGSVHCRGLLGHSHMQESSADIFGYDVLGSFLKDHPLPPGASSNPKRIFGFFLGEGCAQQAKASAENDFDHHASDLERVTKIGLSLPSMRTALGCSGHSAGLSCDYRPAASNGAAESVRTTR